MKEKIFFEIISVAMDGHYPTKSPKWGWVGHFQI